MVLALMLCFGGVIECFAQAKPFWAAKGEKSVNKKRVSDNYTFKVFNTHSMNPQQLKADGLNSLLEYLHGEYGASVASMTVDTTAIASNGRNLIKVSFPDGDAMATVYAQRVDDYSEFNDYDLNVFQYEYYQLYAVTGKNATPEFDTFEVSDSSPITSLACSLIPGVGQMYKGQTTKGCVFLGGEAVLITTAIVSQVCKNRFDKKVDNQIPNVDSWKSKSKSWKQVRNISIGLACGLYVYNLIDAAVDKGSRRLSVKRNRANSLAIAPWTTADGAGLSFALRF